MQPIYLNSVIQYIADDGEVLYERVLWMDSHTDKVVVFGLDDDFGFPIWKKLSDINYLLESKQCKLVDYQSKGLVLHDDEISERDKLSVEKAWSVVKDLVENEPEIYMEISRRRLIEKVSSEHSINKKYIHRKLRKFWKYGKVKNALLPRNFNGGAKGKTRKSTRIKRGRPYKDKSCNNIGMNITDDIKDTFKKAYKEFYNNATKRSMQSAYYKMLEVYFKAEIVTDLNGEKVVKAPEGDKIPSYSQFHYWYKRLNNIKDTIISRQGSRDFELNHKAVLGESTTEAYNPGSMFQVDATIADIYLVSRDNRNWIIGRPVLYIIIDVFSRLICGFYVGLEGPSWMGAMMALYNTARNKVELCKEYGIEISENEWNCDNLPETLIVDRGELESTKPYNLINNLGINVKVLPPYKANWKGIVEQSFRRLNEKSLHWLKGTVPREFRVRGERDYRKDALLNLDEFTRIIIHNILYFNNSYMDGYNRDEQMKAEGVKPIPSVLWEWGIINRGGLLKSFPEDIIKLNLMPYDDAKITFKGLEFKKMHYSCADDIESGAYEMARKYGSKAVRISYDPRNLRYVYTNEGLSYKKYTLTDTQKAHLYMEEVNFNIEYNNNQKRNNQPQKIASTVKLNLEIDEIVKCASHDAKEQDEKKKKDIKGIRGNRQVEKSHYRDLEMWELGKQEGQDKTINVTYDGKYIPGPDYINFIEDDE
jgi:hypothetical protein